MTAHFFMCSTAFEQQRRDEKENQIEEDQADMDHDQYGGSGYAAMKRHPDHNIERPQQKEEKRQQQLKVEIARDHALR